MIDLVPKGGWRIHRFDDMASVINDRIDNPEEAGVDRYVGLEHLDSDSLRIRRWGSPSDVTATKLLFRRGDIVFGRRRVYQRKLAVADFDGICSAHAMVLRAKPDVVLPEFLPFFMQSDMFMERAKEISVGSLSPTINWKTLAKEEFPLPPLDEQLRLAGCALAAKHLSEILERIAGATRQLRKSVMAEILDDSSERWPRKQIGDTLNVVTGGTPSRSNPRYWDGDVPWVKTGEVNFQVITETEERITLDGLSNSAAKLCPPGSVLVALYGQGPTRGRVAMLDIEAATNQACAVILPGPEVDPWFLFFYLEGQYEALRRLAHGAAQPNLNLGMIRDFSIPVPPMEEQQKLVTLIHSVADAETRLGTRHVDLDVLRRILIESTWS
jgi:type I restriction enzyme S subunit